MFSDDGYTEAENSRLKTEVEDLKTEIATLKAGCDRRDSTNGGLMDDIACQKELIQELEEELNDTRQRLNNTAMAKLDMQKALGAAQAAAKQAHEEIGRLRLINRCPNAYSALVASLTTYVTESVDAYKDGMEMASE